MEDTVLHFIEKEHLSVLSVVLGDGSVHSAVVHFSSGVDGTRFYIQTSSTTVKAEPVLSGDSCFASLAIGFSEQDWVTLQMRGKLRLVAGEDEVQKVQALHHAKIPDALKRMGPTTIFLEFVPSWFRYTDFQAKPPTIITKK